MAHRAFRVGSWVAALVGGVMALAAATVLVVGVLALTGAVRYPVTFGAGPLSFRHEVTMPVGFGGDVCQSASTLEQTDPTDCIRFFVHGENSPGSSPVRTQDADVRPTTASLTGTLDLATKGGWSGFVAASVGRTAVGLTVTSAVLLLLSRLLAGAAAGAVFGGRSVAYVRAIGWVLIGGSAAEALLRYLGDPFRLNYSFEAFGTSGPMLVPMGQISLDVTQLALGGLVLLLAEVFRHGAAVEDEQRLTV